MACINPDCLGNYDFENIVFYARKRFIDGCNTITLMEQANSEREKEEIAFISLLDVDDDQIRDLQLSCRYKDECTVMDCRQKLKKMITNELKEHC